jgi:hypothetical protein
MDSWQLDTRHFTIGTVWMVFGFPRHFRFLLLVWTMSQFPRWFEVSTREVGETVKSNIAIRSCRNRSPQQYTVDDPMTTCPSGMSRPNAIATSPAGHRQFKDDQTNVSP